MAESTISRRRQQSQNIWLIGNSIDALSQTIIPTNGDILKLFFHLKNCEFKTEKSIKSNSIVADAVCEAVLEVWHKTGIETQRKDKIKEKITKLHDEYRNVQKRKGQKSNETKQNNFVAMLENYIFIAHINAEETIRKDRLRNDLMFLKLREKHVVASQVHVDLVTDIREVFTVFFSSYNRLIKQFIQQNDTASLVRLLDNTM